MQKTEKYNLIKFILIAVFLLIEAVFYVTFLYSDFNGLSDKIYLKYTSVILCFLMTFLFNRDLQNFKYIVPFALLFTLVSDFFLLVINDNFELGILSFCVAQILYFVIITLIKNPFEFKSLIIRIIIRLGIVGLVIIILGIVELLDTLTGIACFYFINLVINCIESGFLIKKDFRYILLFIGFFLFILCDICVLFNNISSYLQGDFIDFIQPYITKLMWFFYLPSQILIVLSFIIPKNVFLKR